MLSETNKERIKEHELNTKGHLWAYEDNVAHIESLVKKYAEKLEGISEEEIGCDLVELMIQTH